MACPQELVTLLDPEGGSFPLGGQKLLYNPLSKALYMGQPQTPDIFTQALLSVLPFWVTCRQLPPPHTHTAVFLISLFAHFVPVTLDLTRSSMLCCSLIPCKHRLASQTCSGPHKEAARVTKVGQWLLSFKTHAFPRAPRSSANQALHKVWVTGRSHVHPVSTMSRADFEVHINLRFCFSGSSRGNQAERAGSSACWRNTNSSPFLDSLNIPILSAYHTHMHLSILREYSKEQSWEL